MLEQTSTGQLLIPPTNLCLTTPRLQRTPSTNLSEVPLSREAKQHLEAYLEWRHQIGGAFDPTPDSPMFLCQDPKHRGERLGYKGLYKMVKKLGAIASVNNIRPHRFRYDLGTTITRKRVAPLYSKELMGIKSDKVYCHGLLEYLSDHKTTFGQ